MNRFLRTVIYGEISRPKDPPYKVKAPKWLKRKPKTKVDKSRDSHENN